MLGHASTLFVNCWLIVNITHSFNPNLKNYADAKEFCETAAKNGFKAGRLFEPKTQSLNDKVYSESIEVFGEKKWAWIGISAKRGSWVYTSSGIELEFQNWDPQNWGLGQANNDAHDCVVLALSKSLERSPAVGDFYGSGIEIWAGFGPVRQLLRPVFSCFHGQKTFF